MPAVRDAHALPGRWIAAGAVLLAMLCAGAVVYAWNAQQRVKGLEQQLVRRQDDSSAQAAEAQAQAKQAQESARDAAAKVALLEARVAETTMQRTQLEELIHSLSRSRDENEIADVEASIRVAQQQAAITGSAEPLVLALKQAEERLARQDQPRLEGVRRAVVQDLERVRAAGAVDVSTLAMRLDEVVRAVDELPLLSAPQAQRAPARQTARAAAPAASASAASAAASAAVAVPDPAWIELLGARWAALGAGVWDEVRRLVRVTPIEHPEAVLVAPEQAYFVRENLKLRLLNARLALLSRQFDTAQADLRDALATLERYFDRSSKRTTGAIELLRQVSVQARHVTVPRPDATLAAIAAVAGR
ncbi:MAG TPA: uroporphyrinogen-III C-methyltransferase [Rubrivivax sp.]|nr:uroporphyrinogen-III C-methyltransferase [Rubrivivax sp.]